MTRPPEMSAEPRPRRGRSILGVVAYVLLPGKRRRRARGHFRRAGFEVLRGLGELARSDRPSDEGQTGRRERIEIEQPTRAQHPLPQKVTVKRLIKQLGEAIRKKAPAAGPAARDAALHGAKEFAKIFWKKYTENRRKR